VDPTPCSSIITSDFLITGGEGVAVDRPAKCYVSQARQLARRRGQRRTRSARQSHCAAPDVIITETRLPGITLCGLLRRDVATSAIPVIFVTGDPFPADVERAMAAGGDLVLTKPWAHRRGDTVNPPIAPPTLVCPLCDRPLMYRRSHVGGVSSKHSEQWDYFDCEAGCGTFQYRTRTRKLRKVP
jgi:CheY-like chemotaxis protein